MLRSISALLFFAAGFTSLAAEIAFQKPTLRRILVVDFVNQKHDAATNFLIQSIPNAFMKPLEKTHAFEILDPQKGRTVVEALEIAADELYDIETAVRLGKAANAEIVIIGNFIVMQNRIQIQAQAIDVASGRVRVSDSEVATADSRIFESINALTERMSEKIRADVVPVAVPVPKPQAVRSRRDYGTMVGLTLVAPGAGHLYANEWRGGIYASVAAISAVGFLFGHFFYTSNYNAYQSAVADFDTFYNKAQDWKKVRGYSSYVFLATYIIALVDILITGPNLKKAFVSPFARQNTERWQIIVAGPSPQPDLKEHGHEHSAALGLLRYF
ncbi:MAG: hypothetical protein KF713_15980 [Turneriella sp.]|nr:hypothetical protein [Turneriella sp.]